LALAARVVEVLLVGAGAIVMVVSSLVRISNLFWHRWECDTFWKIWKWVDQVSLLVIVVEE